MLRVPAPAAALLAALGCAGLLASQRATPPGLRDNLLANPGFEQGRRGWTHPTESPAWGDFEVVEAPVHTGRRAVHLRLRAGPDDGSGATGIYGVMQELAPERFPDVIGGWYRVDRWEKEDPATDLYLQAVVIVWSPDAPRVLNPANPSANAGVPNYQLRSYLAGVAKPPFRLGNARVVFVSKEPPPLGRWTWFEVPVRDEFQRQWRGVPTGYDKLRIFFEARWDNRPPGSRVEADVTYDDVFLGYADATR